MRVNKGFTLVEVIVAAVIVLALAAVAIPMYNGFVMDARQSSMDSLAETAAAAANSIWRRMGNEADAVLSGPQKPGEAPLKLHFNDGVHSVRIVGNDVVVEETENGRYKKPLRGDNAAKVSFKK